LFWFWFDSKKYFCRNQRKFLELAAASKAPAAAQLQQLLTPISQSIQAIQQFREKNRASKLFNHLSAISESIPALGWVAVVRTRHNPLSIPFGSIFKEPIFAL